MLEQTKNTLNDYANGYGVNSKVWKEIKDVENGVKTMLIKIKQLEHEARIGRAVMKAFEEGHKVIKTAYVDSSYDEYGEEEFYVSFEGYINTKEGLLEWAEGVE